MNLKVSIGGRLRSLGAKFKDTLNGQVEKEFEKQLEQAIGEIVARTQAGKDYRGRAFKPYTPEYKAFKNGEATRGGRATSLSSSRRSARAAGKVARGSAVNLTYTGKMLAAIRAKVERAGNALVGTLYFLPSEALKAKGNQKDRPFFGLSDKQIKQLVNAIKEAMLK